MTTNIDFPTAIAAKKQAEERAQNIFDSNISHIKEDIIEPALKRGDLYCEIGVWDIKDESIEFIRSKGYTVSDLYKNSRSIYIISWGDVDVTSIYPNDVPPTESEDVSEE